MPVTEHPPHRTGRAAFPHPAPTRMFDGEALVGPWVKDAWLWEPLVREPVDPVPPRAVLLAAPRQRAHPEHHDVVPERGQGVDDGWHCVIGKEACRHLPKPLSLAGDRIVHPPHSP